MHKTLGQGSPRLSGMSRIWGSWKGQGSRETAVIRACRPEHFRFSPAERGSRFGQACEGVVVLNKGMIFPELGFRKIVAAARGECLRREHCAHSQRTGRLWLKP